MTLPPAKLIMKKRKMLISVIKKKRETKLLTLQKEQDVKNNFPSMNLTLWMRCRNYFKHITNLTKLTREKIKITSIPHTKTLNEI